MQALPATGGTPRAVTVLHALALRVTADRFLGRFCTSLLAAQRQRPARRIRPCHWRSLYKRDTACDSSIRACRAFKNVVRANPEVTGPACSCNRVPC